MHAKPAPSALSLQERLPLLIVPAVAFVSMLLLRSAAGPAYAAPSVDPSYPYLMNGLAVAVGEAVGHQDHPGITLQSLMALVIRAFSSGADGPSIIRDVVERPEAFLAYAFAAMALLFVLGLWWLGIVVDRRQGRWLALLGQLSFLSWSAVWTVGQIPKAEAMLLALSPCLLASVVRARPSEHPSAARELVVGLMFGLLLLTKVTALPLLVLVVLTTDWKRGMLRVGTAALVFVAAFALPWFQLRIFLGFGTKLTRFEGYNASAGDLTMVGRLLETLGGELTLLLAEPVAWLVVATTAWALWEQRREHPGLRNRVTTALPLLIVLAGVGFTAFGPMIRFQRYLLPTLVATSAALLFLGRFWQGPAGHARQRWGAAAMALSTVVALTRASLFLSASAEHHAPPPPLAELEPCRGAFELYAWPASNPHYALMYGSHWARDLAPAQIHAVHGPGAILVNSTLRVLVPGETSVPVGTFLKRIGAPAACVLYTTASPIFLKRADDDVKLVGVGQTDSHAIVRIERVPETTDPGIAR